MCEKKEKSIGASDTLLYLFISIPINYSFLKGSATKLLKKLL
jgi:hypothetical protein